MTYQPQLHAVTKPQDTNYGCCDNNEILVGVNMSLVPVALGKMVCIWRLGALGEYSKVAFDRVIVLSGVSCFNLLEALPIVTSSFPPFPPNRNTQ